MFSDSMMLGGGRQAAFSIANSVRMDGVADYFSRTPSVEGNRKTFTFSGWVKRNSLGQQYIFGADWQAGQIGFNSDDSLIIQLCDDTNTVSHLSASSAIFRDMMSWYHLVMSVDTTAASGKRVKGYVNGTEVIGEGLGVYREPSLGDRQNITRSAAHTIGRYTTDYYYFNGYISDVHFIDGAILTPSTFGETDPLTGSWRPKKVNISDYGTNGFHLDFNDPADLGRDVSGKGNHWIPVSLGAADVVADTPTNNFCTWNQLKTGSGSTVSGLSFTLSSASGQVQQAQTTGTIAVSSGAWEFVVTPKTNAIYSAIGICKTSHSVGTDPLSTSGGVALAYAAGGNKYNGSSGSAYGASYTNNDTIKCRFDLINGTVEFFKNGVSQGVAFTGVSGEYQPIICATGSGVTITGTSDFGQAGFAPATGYKALCTANLPTPSITNPGKHMDVVTYTGTGGTQAITGLSFQPDLVWIKQRNTARSHVLVDSIRGANKSLSTDWTGTEATNQTNGHVSSLDSSGFTVTAGETSALNVNENGGTYVAWCWKAGGAAVSNTDGTIPSMVSVNPTAGFSIVSYAGTATNATVGHGLGVAPKLVIIKGRTNLGGSTMQWDVWHTGLAIDEYLVLNSTDGKASAPNVWNGAIPNASTINLGDAAAVNAIGDQYVAYCWAEVSGFSKFGSYTGNGSTDGPFVHCGFRPRYILIGKTAFGAGWNWQLIDTARSSSNVFKAELNANTSGAENTSTGELVDITASGFKPRSINGATNENGETYIFAAFAEAPFGGKKTVPAKAR